MNAAQTTALDFAKTYGRVYAGKNHTKQMAVIRVAASTLRALERQGLVTCDQELGTGQLFATPV